MTLAAASATRKKIVARTSLKRETSALSVLLRRLVNGILNRIFALDVRGSHRRRNVLNILFFLAVVFFVLSLYPLSFWIEELKLVFSAFFTNPAALKGVMTNFFNQLIDVLIDARVLRLFPLLFLPFYLAKEAAASYLADIFEIKELSIARQFINEVALRGGNNELHISAARILEKQIEQSPIEQIGGPGYVTIDLDAAILVEKPDGRPRVIGPGQWTTLDGFERIRDMIDLRDQVLEPFEVSARSKDGIPISITDARVIFSVNRDKRTPTPSEPHPFSKDAVRDMVFNKVHRVTEGERIHQSWYRSAGDPMWVTAMKSLIMRDLAIFMGTRKLEEFLASIGAPEALAIQKIEQAIANGSAPAEEPPPASPTFTPRSELSKLFSEFAQKFNNEQKRRGVQSQWVGVGTWKMPQGIPSQLIPERHIEAWRLTIENLARGGKQALENIERDARLLELQLVARNGPIQIHQSNLFNELEYPKAFKNLFEYYRSLFNDAIDAIPKSSRAVPPSIVAAYYEVSQYYERTYKMVGSHAQRPAAASREEEQLYNDASSRIGRDAAIERLLDIEEELHPGTGRVERLKRIISAWDAEMADEPPHVSFRKPPSDNE